MKIKVPKIPFQSMAKSFQSLTIKTWAVLTASPDISSLTPQSCLAVSIHSGTVSFIYLTRKLKKYTVQAERVFRFTEKLFPQPRDILSYVHIFFDETGLPRVPIIIVVPKSWVIIKRGELPIAVENFLSEAVANEMDTLTPFSVEEVLYDFTIVQRTDTTVSFILGTIKAERINTYMESLRQDGLSIAGLSIDLETLGTFLSMVNKNIPDKFLFCSISGKNIEIAGYRNETLDFIHIDTLGHDKEKYATVISEIINSIREHLLIDDDNGSEIPLFLDCDNISVKDELLNNSDMAVTLLEMIDTSSFKLTNQGKSIFSATGAALETLRPDIDDMNLLLRGKREKTKNSYFITIILILLLMVLYVSNDLIPYYKSKETLDELSESVEKLESSVNQAKKMKKKIKELKESIATIEDFGLRAFLPLEITKELTAIIPIDTWLTRLRIRTDTIELEGYSQSATTLIVKLEESRFFKKVEFSSPTIKDRRLKMDRFRIRADINDNRKESKEKKK